MKPVPGGNVPPRQRLPKGLVLLGKPAGLTSFQALSTLKKRLGTGKVGHAGTLDKFATGLLVILVGPYSRLVPFIVEGEKVYRGLVRFGSETDTLDPEGKVIAEAPPPDRSAVESALRLFQGSILQRPPAFSAIHLSGKRAYERVLAGEDPVMPERSVRIHELSLESWDGRDARIRVRCGSGTYIRSLARDIALACGSRAHLVELERLSIGPFSLSDAVAPESFDASTDIREISPDEIAALGVDAFALAEERRRAFMNGGVVEPAALASISGEAAPRENFPVAVFSQERELLGIVELHGDRLCYRMVVGGGE